MNALTTPNKTLFLSYSRQQTVWCDDLYTAIDIYTPFQRWRDNKIPESADWWDSICLNIEGCFAFVAILTQDYLKSVYCMGELDYALQLNKPVIALMLQEDIEYPPILNEKRLQFAKVAQANMQQVITKLLNASTQITLSYTQDEFSTDISPRKHLRPPVPMPGASTHAPEEDQALDQQIRYIDIHGQIPTRDLVRRYSEEKTRNVRLARDLLDKIAERNDVPSFFDIDEADKELQVAEERFAAEERERQRIKQIQGEYADLADYVNTINARTALRAIKRFISAYPDFGDPQQLLKQYTPTSTELLLPPFDWITIPKKGYSIAKYPVTNAQFARFVNAQGYEHDEWWTAEGKKYRNQERWREPRYWRDSQWNGAEQPVVGISWFEAVAFCLWLSDATGENIMLPTELQWQYAARGKRNRIYPWGNEWDCKRCNNAVKPCDSNGTTPVTQYEGNAKGESPFGVVDMAGNVWEWCLTDYDYRTNDFNAVANKRVWRGGAWDIENQYQFRCNFRDWRHPSGWLFTCGFRIVRNEVP